MNVLEHVKTKPTIDRSNINAGFNEYIWEFESDEYPIWCLFYKEVLCWNDVVSTEELFKSKYGDIKPAVYVHVCQKYESGIYTHSDIGTHFLKEGCTTFIEDPTIEELNEYIERMKTW